MAQSNLKEEAERRYPVKIVSESLGDSLRQIIINLVRLAFVDGCEYMAEKVKEEVDKMSQDNYLSFKEATDQHMDHMASAFMRAATEDIEVIAMLDDLIGDTEY